MPKIRHFYTKQRNHEKELLENDLEDIDFNVEVFVDFIKRFCIRLRHKKHTKVYRDFLLSEFNSKNPELMSLDRYGAFKKEDIPNVLKYVELLRHNGEYTYHNKNDEDTNPIFLVLTNAYKEYKNNSLEQNSIFIISTKEVYLSRDYVIKVLGEKITPYLASYARELVDMNLITRTYSNDTAIQLKPDLTGRKRYYCFDKEVLKYV